MPKRKVSTEQVSGSHSQPSLSKFLSSSKLSHQPALKKVKLVKEEAGPPVRVASEEISEGIQREQRACESTPCESTPSSSPISSSTEPSAAHLLSILDVIDEVILFSEKPLLWSQIQEEIYSLHKRSIELEHLKGILNILPELYRLETGFKRLPTGGFKSEYKLSIPPDQTQVRRFRFKLALKKPVSEYTMPLLPSKPIVSSSATKKALQIKDKTTPKAAAPQIKAEQKPISIFLNAEHKSPTVIADRKTALLERIRAKASTPTTPLKRLRNSAWDRVEECIHNLLLYLSLGEKTNYRISDRRRTLYGSRVSVSLKKTITEFCMGSTIPVSEGVIRESIVILCECVPWFCKIVKMDERGCMSDDVSSSQSIQSAKGAENESGKSTALSRTRIGKENGEKKSVEAILIYAMKDGKLIGSEDVLKEFRVKRKEWEQSQLEQDC